MHYCITICHLNAFRVTVFLVSFVSRDSVDFILQHLKTPF